MSNIYLYGHLAEKYGSDAYDLAIKNPAEGVKALCMMIPGFTQDIRDYNFQILVGDLEDPIDLDEESLNLITSRDIHIVPVVEGSKNKGLGKIIAGVALIAVVAFAGPLGIGAIMGTTMLGTTIGAMVASVGFSMVLGGASMLLSSQAKANLGDSPTDDPNSIFASGSGTARQGSCIPLLLGEMYCDLTPISASIQSGIYAPISGAGGVTTTTQQQWNVDSANTDFYN
jgi:predicted phage tail protein